ncbi:MAG: translation initiation factor Sui1 [Gemmatimonadetes bacterium]|jgi:translation initiation factor 1|nr:translation initiation factor Sui1 [Gemmatimonadota bacterium]
MAKSNNSRLVYSSDQGRICPDCGKPSNKCKCRGKSSKGGGGNPPPGDGVGRVRREVKGRRGKTVTTISGLSLSAGDLRELAAGLKRRCGSGGSVKEGVIEIQGDHADLLVEELQKLGHKAKRAGG